MSDIDELLIEAKRVCGERWQKAPEYPWEVAARFGAEVERLRAENTALRQVHVDTLPKNLQWIVWNTPPEVAAHAVSLIQGYQAKVAELEAENAELKENASATLYHEALRLKKRLAWFEERQLFFTKLAETVDRSPSNPSYLHAILEGLRLWDSENPRPGS